MYMYIKKTVLKSVFHKYTYKEGYHIYVYICVHM